MFARPKGAGSTTPGLARKATAKNVTPGRSTPSAPTTARSVTTGMASTAASNLLKPTKASSAKTFSIKAQLVTPSTGRTAVPSSKSGGRPLAVVAVRPDLQQSKTDSKDEMLSTAERMYDAYLQAEFTRLSSTIHKMEAARVMEKKSSALWLATSSLSQELNTKRRQIDEIGILLDFLRAKKPDCEDLEKLLAKLPDVEEKLKALAEAVRKSQNYLRVSGANVAPGDLDRLDALLSAKGSLFEDIRRLLQLDASREMSDSVSQLASLLQSSLDSHESCGALSRDQIQLAVRQESLAIGVADSSPISWTLHIPPNVETPKLIDF